MAALERVDQNHCYQGHWIVHSAKNPRTVIENWRHVGCYCSDLLHLALTGCSPYDEDGCPDLHRPHAGERA